MSLFPLKEKILIRGCQAHKNAGLSCAADYRARYVPLYAEVDGEAYRFETDGGGLWVALIGEDGHTYEHAHMSQRITPQRVVQGQQIGVTGNTGQLSSGAHLHLQIKDRSGRRIDPESVLWSLNHESEDNVTREKKRNLLKPFVDKAVNHRWRLDHYGAEPSQESLNRDIDEITDRYLDWESNDGGEEFIYNRYQDQWDRERSSDADAAKVKTQSIALAEEHLRKVKGL